MKYWHLLLLTAWSSSAFAQTASSAFSQSELRVRAQAFLHAIGKGPQSAEIAVYSSQFFGYVAGHIDARKFGPNTAQHLVGCTRRLKMNEIVRRTAEIIQGGRAESGETVDFTIGFAIDYACAEDKWKSSYSNSIAPTGVSPSWLKFGENDRLVAYFQPSSTTSEKTKTASVLYDYKAEQESPRSGRHYKSQKGQHEIDCDGERSRTTFFTWHEGRMGDGAVVYTGSKAMPWEPNLPGSFGMALAAMMCQRR